ncbi:G:T/U mismatch-specific uracil/thymine DNA-glycosylase [hydrothermal vent metagenome]|uniref:G:T/U mismatch-specific uracil/thymine DNA-glycosylase n=1 Tax=hydrothermal vent metagenome TaxID=652676 RepID=A0A3B0WBZ3_9ZZZZ
MIESTELCTGFPPIIPPEPKVLILGTMPSVVSLREDFYYAHSRNAFWPIMASLFGESPTSKKEKSVLCQKKGIFLWDVLQACQRKGSLDSAIQRPVANDFESLFQRYPDLKNVAFNGKAAEKLFQKEVLSVQDLPKSLHFISLPSTSPAYAAMSLESKRLLWQEKLSFLL